MKRCHRCKETKPRSEFGNDRSKRDGLNGRCRECIRAIHHENVRRDPEGFLGSMRERSRRYRDADPQRRWEMARNADLIRQYGITLDDYNAMNEAQGGRCAICRLPERRSGSSGLAVDHCHETGLVRGLLCDSCNVGLGRFKDDPKLIAAAGEYLAGSITFAVAAARL